MKTSRKGNAAELRSMRLLADEGYLCASRRHIGGAGDLLCIPAPNTANPALLAEVKAGRKPFENFRPADRQALRALAARYLLAPVLLYWPPKAREHVMLAPDEWPG